MVLPRRQQVSANQASNAECFLKKSRSARLNRRQQNHHDDAPPPRIIRSLAVNLQTQISQLPTEFRTHQLRHLLERNVLVMARGGLGRRSEDWLRKLIGFSKAARKMNAAHRAACFVFLPGRS